MALVPNGQNIWGGVKMSRAESMRRLRRERRELGLVELRITVRNKTREKLIALGSVLEPENKQLKRVKNHD